MDSFVISWFIYTETCKQAMFINYNGSHLWKRLSKEISNKQTNEKGSIGRLAGFTSLIHTVAYKIKTTSHRENQHWNWYHLPIELKGQQAAFTTQANFPYIFTCLTHKVIFHMSLGEGRLMVVSIDSRLSKPSSNSTWHFHTYAFESIIFPPGSEFNNRLDWVL